MELWGRLVCSSATPATSSPLYVSLPLCFSNHKASSFALLILIVLFFFISLIFVLVNDLYQYPSLEPENRNQDLLHLFFIHRLPFFSFCSYSVPVLCDVVVLCRTTSLLCLITSALMSLSMAALST